jgi:hypothetical protein
MRWYYYLAYFFGGAFLRERLAALWQRNLWARIPKPFRIAARSRLVLFDGQRRMGLFQPGGCLSARVPCRQL